MARKSIIARQKRREKCIKRYAERRKVLVAVVRNPASSMDERRLATIKIEAMPRDASPIRSHNRCHLTGRARGVYRKFGLARSMLRKLAMEGHIPGIVKASW
jgi:small subunit ribosomal protein S14